MDRGDLDRLKNAVIEVALDARQGVNDFPIADAKTDAPAGHVVAFRQGEKFHADLFGARHLEKTRRFVTVEGQIGIGKIVHDEEAMLLSGPDDPLKKIALDNLRRRVVRKADDQHFRFGPGLANRLFQVAEKSFAGGQRDAA